MPERLSNSNVHLGRVDRRKKSFIKLEFGMLAKKYTARYSGYVKYCITRNFRGRKLSRFGGNKIFVDKTFADCSLVSLPKDATPPQFCGENFRK